MSRTILAIAAFMLPLPALAQSAPAAPAQPEVKAPEQRAPAVRGFSIAKPGAPAAAAATTKGGAIHVAEKPAMEASDAKPGKMKGHGKRHHRRHRHH